MKKLCAAAIALSLLAGPSVAQEAKMSRETIIMSTQDAAVDDNWVGAALTFIVLILAFGSGAAGAT